MRVRLALPVAAAVLTALAAPALSAQPDEPGRPGSSADSPAAVAGEVLVGYVDGSTGVDRARARGRADARFSEDVVRGRAPVELVQIPQGKARERAIAELEADPAVAYAEPNWIYTHDATSNDPYYTGGSLWGMYGDSSPLRTNQYGSQAAEAWAAGNTGSSDVYIGVIDEGLEVTHPDLAANVWNNPYDPADGVDNDGNGYVDDRNGWDFVSNNSSVYDGSADDHGTHVAGTIGAVGGNGAGVAGVAWDVTLISTKFLGANGGTTANAVKAVDYLTDLKVRHGLNIVATNNSWGGGGYSQSLFDAITRAGAQQILFIAAAGNGGQDKIGDNNDAIPHYPSSYTNPTIISVASITSSGARSSFSNYGVTSVDIGAPGSGINSTLPGGGYGSYSGTSMATPHVTGAVALYAAGHPGASAVTTKAAVLDAGVPTTSMASRTTTGDRLNASGFLPGTPPPNQAPVAGFTAICDNMQCNFTNTSTDEDAATLTYLWSYGDGTGSTAVQELHTYTAAGEYSVTLTATDAQNLSDSHTGFVKAVAPSGNTAPIASFTVACTYLACTFTDTSTDDKGVTGWNWSATDSWAASTQHPSHSFNGAGEYRVTLRVNDVEGLTSSVTQTVTVTAAPADAIVLNATGLKTKGVQRADLTWSGSSATGVDVYRNGNWVTTTANDGAHTDAINNKGGGSYSYKICNVGTTTCSNTVTVTF